MTELPIDLAEPIAAMAREISADTARSVAARARALDAHRAAQLVTQAPSLAEADLLGPMIKAWRKYPEVDGVALGLALLSSQASAAAERAKQQVELIWTGPAGRLSAMRRTDQALLEVISTAQERLLIVTFAAYEMAGVNQRLVEAMDRGVRVTIVLEFAEDRDGSLDTSKLNAFGTEIRDRASVYYWPFEKREKIGNARGVLHVKCAVADRDLAYISSANLTGSAMNRNMELGVIVRGGPIPARIGLHFDALAQSGVLTQLAR